MNRLQGFAMNLVEVTLRRWLAVKARRALTFALLQRAAMLPLTERLAAERPAEAREPPATEQAGDHLAVDRAA